MIAIALAGGLGAAARLAVDGLIRSHVGEWIPWGTALVNVLGSFLLGVLTGSAASAAWQEVAGAGFLGGFTTFSAASFETARLALDRRPWACLGYAVGVLVVCVAVASAGFALGRL